MEAGWVVRERALLLAIDADRAAWRHARVRGASGAWQEIA